MSRPVGRAAGRVWGGFLRGKKALGGAQCHMAGWEFATVLLRPFLPKHGKGFGVGGSKEWRCSDQ